MNFLAPLFLAGGLVVALPILFHLVRQKPKQRIAFSSLMFLSPVPRRVVQRSRFDQILLLLLRCAMLALLAIGFARPFFPQRTAASASAGGGKRIALLMDTSASMQREGLWRAALDEVGKFLRTVSVSDEVAVFAFNRALQPVVTFEQWNGFTPPQRAAEAIRLLSAQSPGWSATHLGHSLTSAAEMLADAENRHGNEANQRPLQVVAISDFQQGARTDGLQGFAWPKTLEVRCVPLKTERTSNGGVQLVSGGESLSARPRIRVSNAAVSTRERFQLRWQDASQTHAIQADVPPGQAKTFPLPATFSASAKNQIELLGDEQPFDNVLHVLPAKPRESAVLFLGDRSDAEAPGMFYFLKRAFSDTPQQSIRLHALTPDQAAIPADAAKQAPALAIVADDSTLTDASVATARKVLDAGHVVLFVMKSASSASSLARLSGTEIAATEVSGDALLADIDFQHPIFAPFADPRFSDWTKIHWWKHRRVTLPPGAKVLARFDNGDAAFFEMAAGSNGGNVLVMTSGWHPADSQLALSSKFVPMLYALLEWSTSSGAMKRELFIGDDVPLPAGAERVVTKPDGAQIKLAASESKFTGTDMPGIYTVSDNGAVEHFAVNIDPRESETAPMSPEALARLGLPLRSLEAQTQMPTPDEQRHALNTEIEAKQKLWRWLIVAALGVGIAETLFAGWLSRRPAAQPS